MKPLSVTPEVEALAREGAWFAYSVSGGKDGNAAALATDAWLDRLGHPRLRRLAIHSDLGLIEWRDSLRMCREVAARLDLPLIEVQPGRDMIGRWRNRWENALARYARLATVTLIAPWSSPENRFCTSELKTQAIGARLRKLAGADAAVVSVTGVRAQESFKRARQPVSQPDPELTRPSRGLRGAVWRPIHAWTLEDVREAHRELGFRLHQAYTVHGASRVSCSFCIMSSLEDVRAATGNPENLAAFQAIIALEAESGFSFQSARWLGDARPGLLTAEARDALAVGKARRAARVQAESFIPKELRYVGGWPAFVPDLSQCEVLAAARRQVCGLYGLASPYLNAGAVQERYRELSACKHDRRAAHDAKEAARRARAARKAAPGPPRRGRVEAAPVGDLLVVSPAPPPPAPWPDCLPSYPSPEAAGLSFWYGEEQELPGF